MHPMRTAWTYYCPKCDYWGSSLNPINTTLDTDKFLDESIENENPIEYLDSLRIRNFDFILNQLKNHERIPGRLLEVGCGAGLFLDLAEKHGYTAKGIEAYPAMANSGIGRGRDIQIGMFPHCLMENELFGAIVFNDVFEHLPEVNEILAHCHRHLAHGGLLVINLPNSRGLFYQIANAAARIGYYAPWDRLWQRMFFTPHLHYFSPTSLESISNKAGFISTTKCMRLESVTIRGLWGRIKADKKTTTLQRLITWCGTITLSKLTPFFPSDCIFQVFSKRP